VKAIWIVPDMKTLPMVQEIDVGEGSLTEIYKVLDCNLVDVIRLDEFGNVMYVDDEGYMGKDYFFRFGKYPAPIAGRGLIMGTNQFTGDTIETTLNYKTIAAMCEPLTAQQAYDMARQADKKAAEHIAKSEKEGMHTIHIPIAEIMESAWYSDQLT